MRRLKARVTRYHIDKLDLCLSHWAWPRLKDWRQENHVTLTEHDSYKPHATTHKSFKTRAVTIVTACQRSYYSNNAASSLHQSRTTRLSTVSPVTDARYSPIEHLLRWSWRRLVPGCLISRFHTNDWKSLPPSTLISVNNVILPVILFFSPLQRNIILISSEHYISASLSFLLTDTTNKNTKSRQCYIPGQSSLLQ